MAQPMNISDAYSTQRQLYEAGRLDLSKGIMSPEAWFAKVVETADIERAAREKSAEEWDELIGRQPPKVKSASAGETKSANAGEVDVGPYQAATGFLSHQRCHGPGSVR